jgi:NADH-quinone oxidoreductase subunit J
MTFQLLLFYFYAGVLVLSALRVITARNPVHAALFLVLCFVTAAALWLLAMAEFLAITLVLVYVGAVMVLFLFVVMMLDINFDKLREGFWSHLPLAGLLGFVMAVEMGLVLWQKFDAHRMPAAGALPPGSNARALGQVLYTDYFLPFELAAVVLLVAIVAAIALTLRRRKETKSQDAHTQVTARVGERMKIVKGMK